MADNLNKINKRAFDLGAQCRRAGINKERMLVYYGHEKDHSDYNPKDMVDGWDEQDRTYSRACEYCGWTPGCGREGCRVCDNGYYG
jgi:hypothetical protein